MVVFSINAVPYGSTGRIMFQISHTVEEQGGTAYTATSYTKPRGIVFPKNHIQVGTMWGKAMHIGIAKLNGWHGLYSRKATKDLIKEIRRVDPDVVHLHNLHNYYLNLPMFTDYLKQCGKPIVWTLHDCWALTGICPHYDGINCERWKKSCYACPQHRNYPGGRIDRSAELHALKKRWFSEIPNLTIVTPSEWLAKQVRLSYLKKYPVEVINNGIDLTVFRPTAGNFKKTYGLEEKTLLLGVAFEWGYRKGLDVFLEMAKQLDEKYQIVLVGTDEAVDKQLPANILSIHRTHNQQELAEIYSAADVFVNPTREDNFPTVNMEALACGTPVVTFDTGGSPECIDDTCGIVVAKNDIGAMLRACKRICEDELISWEACISRAKKFDKNLKYKQYIELYKEMLKEAR